MVTYLPSCSLEIAPWQDDCGDTMWFAVCAAALFLEAWDLLLSADVTLTIWCIVKLGTRSKIRRSVVDRRRLEFGDPHTSTRQTAIVMPK